MVAESAAFVLFALVTAGASLGVVVVRDVFYDALFLGLALISVAAHFVMLHAEFIAAVQVLVYVGGVMILIVFAIMFMRSTVEGEDETETGVVR
jgi:NADH-quinone oxidoreductase subunit J